jgi:hypothetical protein
VFIHSRLENENNKDKRCKLKIHQSSDNIYYQKNSDTNPNERSPTNLFNNIQHLINQSRDDFLYINNSGLKGFEEFMIEIAHRRADQAVQLECSGRLMK